MNEVDKLQPSTWVPLASGARQRFGELGVSESTARQRVSQVIRRLGVRNATQAVWELRAELEGETPEASDPLSSAVPRGSRSRDRRRLLRVRRFAAPRVPARKPGGPS